MNSEHDDSAQDALEAPVAAAGARLRAAREELRLDLPHIAAETRIPLRHLEAIEEGAYENLPSRAYAIGFSRTYAKAVGLDPAAIIDAVRADLGDGSLRRTVPTSSMAPGDPARVPSAGLAWFGAFAALLLAVGAFAFYRVFFGAGTEPGSLLAPEPVASASPAAGATPAPSPSVAPSPSGPVVLTALEEGVWLRLYEEGGQRLVERTLKQGEAVTVPDTAADPRINTGRPDALAITVGGQQVARLSDRPQTISGVPVSAAALLARAAPGAAPAQSAQAEPASAPRPAVQRQARRVAEPAPAPSPAAEPAPVTPSTADEAAE